MPVVLNAMAAHDLTSGDSGKRLLSESWFRRNAGLGPARALSSLRCRM